MSAPPDESRLRDIAVAHLARFETTRAGLARVLARRIATWAIRAARDGQDADAIAEVTARAHAASVRIVDRLTASGGVDDARFAARRATLDTRAGRSARASQAMLAAKGVAPELARTATARDDDTERDAAVAFARKRGLGPFDRRAGARIDPDIRDDPDIQDDPDIGQDEHDIRQDEPAIGAASRRALGAFARAGFSGQIARRVLAMDRTEAQACLDRLSSL